MTQEAAARLSDATLDGVAATVARPSYDRAALRPGIVHLGVGAFHRAHQAVYIDDILAQDPSWAVLGASLRRADMADALRPQNGLYSLRVDGSDGATHRVVGSLLDVVVAPQDPERLLAAMAAPQTRIVGLTITEKGYARDPASGRLDVDRDDVRADLDGWGARAPGSAVGFIVAALARRLAADVAPFTALSSDNLPDNGAALRGVVLDFVDALGARAPQGLRAWIEAHGAFPSAMVDRIAPAPAEVDAAAAQAALGLRDAAPVATEPFSQWVVEDRFACGRPDLGAVGVELVDDVAPFERMKLRMLNGAHSTIAYLGALAGHTHVADVMADAPLRTLVEGLMRREAARTVDLPEATLTAYADRLLTRFDNPALRHRVAQIAMDGSQKLPQRLLAPIRESRASGRPAPRATLGVAGWIAYASGRAVPGGPARGSIDDPLAARFAEIAASAGEDAAALAAGFLDLRAVFGDLVEDAAFRGAVAADVASLLASGVRATVRARLASIG